MVSGAIKALRDFDALWSDMTLREQEKLVKTLVERVTYEAPAAR